MSAQTTAGIHARCLSAARSASWAVFGPPAAVLFIVLAGWPLVMAHAEDMRGLIQNLAAYCRHYPVSGYLAFGAALMAVILLGLPMSALLMLLAGILYDFWEAAAVVMAGRMAAALLAFLLARHLLTPLPQRLEHMIKTLRRRMRQKGAIYLLFLRVVPLVPDTVVNYGMGVCPVKWHIYLAVSLFGMLPVTLLCIWIGRNLGSLSAIWQFVVG